MENTFDNIRQYLKDVQEVDQLSPKEIKLLSRPQRIKKANLKIAGDRKSVV